MVAQVYQVILRSHTVLASFFTLHCIPSLFKSINTMESLSYLVKAGGEVWLLCVPSEIEVPQGGVA